MSIHPNLRTMSPNRRLLRKALLGAAALALAAGIAGSVLSSRQGNERNLETVMLSNNPIVQQVRTGPIIAPPLPASYSDIPTIIFDETTDGVVIGEYFPVVTTDKTRPTWFLKYVGRADNFLTFYDPVKLREFSVELSPDRDGGYEGSLNIDGIDHKISTTPGNEQPFLFDADGDWEFENKKVDTHHAAHKVQRGETLSSILSGLFYLCPNLEDSQEQYGKAVEEHVWLNGIRNPLMPLIREGATLIINLESLSACERNK